MPEYFWIVGEGYGRQEEGGGEPLMRAYGLLVLRRKSDSVRMREGRLFSTFEKPVSSIDSVLSTLIYLIPIFARTATLLGFSSHTFLQGLFRCRKIAKSVLIRT